MEMRAGGLNLFENGTIDTLGVAGKTSLRTGDAHDPTSEKRSVVPGNLLNGVPFWHDGQRTSGPVRVRCRRARWRVEP